jgi:hypothetical protein
VKFHCTIGFRALKNEEVGYIRTPKKKPNFGKNTHVTLNPRNLGKTSHNSIFSAKLGITP